MLFHKSAGNTDARQPKFVLMPWLFIVVGKAAAHFPCFPHQHLPPLRPYLGTYPDYSLWSLTVKSPGGKCKHRAGSNCGAQLCLNSHGVLLPFRVPTAAAKVATKNKSHQGAGCLVSKINVTCGSFLWHSPNLFTLCRIKSPLGGNQSQFTLAPHRVSSLWKVS